MRRRGALLATAILTAALLVSGCGLNNNRTGRLLVYTDWPPESRSVPSYAQSARITLEPGDGSRSSTQIVNRQTSNRHETMTAFERVPRIRTGSDDFYYQHQVRVQVYSGRNASGSLLGEADYRFQYYDFHFNHELQVADYYQSEIRRMVVNAPNELFISGGARQLGGYAESYSGALIPLPDSAIRFSLANGSEFAEITEDGIITPKAAGTVQVRLEEVDGNVSDGLVTIQVVP